MVIKVENENRIFSFIYDQSEFGNFVLAIRLIDEMKASYLLEAASKAREDYFGDNKQNWYLYKTTKSEFINWFDNLPGQELTLTISNIKLFLHQKLAFSAFQK